jgi:hypothetical protein
MVCTGTDCVESRLIRWARRILKVNGTELSAFNLS